jgi:uncharacterized protein (DUF2141 family)
MEPGLIEIRRPRRPHAVAPGLLAVSLGAASLVAAPLPASAADLAVTVENVRGDNGALRVGLYATEADYRKTAFRQLQVAPRPGTVAFRFDGLPPGEYAIAMYHDRNGNGKLDSNLMGIPGEPYGFTGDGRSTLGPPDWKSAKFRVAEDGAAVSVRLSD